MAWCALSQGSGAPFGFLVLSLVALTLGLTQMGFRDVADEAEQGVFRDFSVRRTPYFSS